MKIARIQKLRNRPSSASYQGNARDPKWMRLFQPYRRKILKLKISKLQPYSTKPKPKDVEINPKFEVKTQSLARVMSHQSITKESQNIDLTLKNTPEFNNLFDRSLSLSKIVLETSRAERMSSRPSTASISRPQTARVACPKLNVENEFLQKRGVEFVLEVQRAWEKLDNRKYSFFEHPENEAEPLPEIPEYPLVRPTSSATHRPMFREKISLGHKGPVKAVTIEPENEGFGIKIQQKVLSARTRKSSGNLSNSSSLKML